MLLATAFTLLVFAVVALTAFNAILVNRLRTHHRQIYEELDQPGIFYFIGLQWMFSDKHFGFVFGPNARELNDRSTHKAVVLVRCSIGLIFVGLILVAAYQFS